jgi:hypothetical protein
MTSVVSVVKKGLILIIFAWVVECIAVVAGFVTAIVTTFPDGELPESKWKWLWVLPMGMIAVAELGRIPLTSVLFYRHKVMQAVAFVGIVFLAGLAFENWMFGFERIVELRLKPVSAADLVLSNAEADRKDAESKRAAAAIGDNGRRDDFKAQLEVVQTAINTENDNFHRNMEAISTACHKVREICVQPQQDKERARHTKAIDPLEKRANELREKISALTDSDRATARKLEDDVTAASKAVSAAEKVKADEISRNQIFRLAAMWYRVAPAKVTPEQFEFVRFWFTVFSAIAVALAGTVSALVYYAKQRIPGDSMWTQLLTKMLRARRAYYVRKRKPVYRDVPVEVEKIVEVEKEKIVDRPVYTEGPPPPITIEKEVVKFIDRIVLIPRWGVRYPVHVNSLIRDDEPRPPPPGGGIPKPPPSPDGGPPNVTEIKRVMRDGR